MTNETNVPSKARTDADRELIKAINNGRSELFRELVGRYERKIYNFGLRMCGDASDAEDLVQETFLNVFRYLSGFRFETKFRNWLYRIAASVCIKKRRKSKFAPERELSLDAFIPKNGEAVPAEVPDWTSLPIDEVLSREVSETVRKAILELPEKYRMVVVLRDLEEFDTMETAGILNITPSNVKVRLHRARLQLREHLKEYFSDEP